MWKTMEGSIWSDLRRRGLDVLVGAGGGMVEEAGPNGLAISLDDASTMFLTSSGSCVTNIVTGGGVEGVVDNGCHGGGMLLSARDMARRKVVTPDEIVYTTQKDVSEQDYEVQEWERRFRELESE